MKVSSMQTKLVRRMKALIKIKRKKGFPKLQKIKFIFTKKINIIAIMRKTASYVIVLNILLLFFFHVDSIKHFFRMIITVLTSEECAKIIYKIYSENIIIFKYFMYITLGVWLILKIIKGVRKLSSNTFDLAEPTVNEIDLYQELDDYIYNDEKKCFVVDGEWGSGKTHTINKFFTRFSKYNNKKVYRISCFGMENRTEILKELKNIFETQDNSLKKHLLNVINKIPLIGDFLEELLKSDYEFKDIEEGSIFIFDDFERINVPNYNMVGKDIDILIKHQKLEKYNIVVGLINELIEQYNMKVIVLLNRKEIDEDFFYDIFEYKMQSYIFNLSHNRVGFYKDRLTEIGLSYVMFTEYIKSNMIKLPFGIIRNVYLFLQKYGTTINIIYDVSEENKRILYKSIATFMEFLKNIESPDIAIIEKLKYLHFKKMNDYRIKFVKYEDYSDIFFSILITNIYKYKVRKNSNNIFKKFDIGDSMGEILKKEIHIHTVIGDIDEYLKEIEIINRILEIIASPVHWCGTKLSDLWDEGNHSKFNTISYVEFRKNKKKSKTIDKYLYEEIIPKLEEDKEYFLDDLIYILAAECEKGKGNLNNNTKEQILEIIGKGNLNLFEKSIVNPSAKEDEIVDRECKIYGIKDNSLIEQIKERIKSNESINGHLNLTIK